MRRIATILTLLLFLQASTRVAGQSSGSRWQAGLGVAGGTLNFKQNAAGALAIPIRFDFASLPGGSLSLGTNLKIGTEDEYGVSFPALLVLLVLSSGGATPDFSNLGSGNASGPDATYSVHLFADFPLLLQYNWGLGTDAGADRRFGWFLGGGATYTITGVSLNSAGHGTSENFFGWVGNAGVRFARNKELALSATVPFQQTIGPIRNPLFFSLTFSFHPSGR